MGSQGLNLDQMCARQAPSPLNYCFGLHQLNFMHAFPQLQGKPTAPTGQDKPNDPICCNGKPHTEEGNARKAKKDPAIHF